MFPPDSPWKPTLAWDTPAGRALRNLASRLPSNRKFQIIVFGSAPLQLGLDPAFLSGDVDVICKDQLADAIQQAGLAKGQADFFIEQCEEHVFIAAPAWRERAHSEQAANVTWIFPHPIDILVAKIKRLEAKDLRAYHLVYSRTGHPTEPELIVALQRVVDVYRPAFDEEGSVGDPLNNTRTVWRELYGREIDVRQEIIRPALQQRRAAYGLDAPPYRQELKDLSEDA